MIILGAKPWSIMIMHLKKCDLLNESGFFLFDSLLSPVVIIRSSLCRLLCVETKCTWNPRQRLWKYCTPFFWFTEENQGGVGKCSCVWLSIYGIIFGRLLIWVKINDTISCAPAICGQSSPTESLNIYW